MPPINLTIHNALKFPFGAKLNIDKRQWERIILSELAISINEAIYKTIPAANSLIRETFKKVIQASDVWQSLDGGSLMGEFGLEVWAARYRLEAVLDKWLEHVKVVGIPAVVKNSRLVGSGGKYAGFQVNLLDLTYRDVLKVPESTIVSKGGLVKWLEWLLTGGTKTIVRDFHIIPAVSPRMQAASRSQLNLMRKGGTWHVPSRAAGTWDDNFATRAITAGEGLFFEQLLREFASHVN